MCVICGYTNTGEATLKQHVQSMWPKVIIKKHQDFSIAVIPVLST